MTFFQEINTINVILMLQDCIIYQGFPQYFRANL